jgi:hypothetical protein
MITCKECIFWNPDEADYERRAGAPRRAGYNCPRCLCPKFDYGYSDNPVEHDGVIIEDDEGWGIVTGPDFGCIHGEPK